MMRCTHCQQPISRHTIPEVAACNQTAAHRVTDDARTATLVLFGQIQPRHSLDGWLT